MFCSHPAAKVTIHKQTKKKGEEEEEEEANINNAYHVKHPRGKFYFLPANKNKKNKKRITT